MAAKPLRPRGWNLLQVQVDKNVKLAKKEEKIKQQRIFWESTGQKKQAWFSFYAVLEGGQIEKKRAAKYSSRFDEKFQFLWITAVMLEIILRISAESTVRAMGADPKRTLQIRQTTIILPEDARREYKQSQ